MSTLYDLSLVKNNWNVVHSLEKLSPILVLNGYAALAKVKILSSLSFNNKISNSKYLMEGIENIEYKDIEIVINLTIE